jgi:lauroyl/myristoyl acyltransferase
MDAYPDRRIEGVRNAEKILKIAEEFIRLAPQQWSMTLPVWPEALDQVP